MSVHIDGKVWSLSEPIQDALDKIELSIDGLHGDPGPLYDIDERVRRVVDALQGKIGVLESRGQR